MTDSISATAMMQRRSLEAMLAAPGAPAPAAAPASRGLAALDMQAGAAGRDPEALLVEFQNILLSEMLKAMRQSVPESGLFEDNTGRELFESFLDEEYIRNLGEQTGGLGLTETLREQLGLARELHASPLEAAAAGRARDES